jgi:hypothetical protein
MVVCCCCVVFGLAGGTVIVDLSLNCVYSYEWCDAHVDIIGYFRVLLISCLCSVFIWCNGEHPVHCDEWLSSPKILLWSSINVLQINHQHANSTSENTPQAAITKPIIGNTITYNKPKTRTRLHAVSCRNLSIQYTEKVCNTNKFFLCC